jgi:hypothetical protein
MPIRFAHPSLKLKSLLLVGLIALTCAVPGLRAEEGVPSDLQAAILMRMLRYDRALQTRAGKAVVVGIVAKAGDRSSVRAKDELAKAIAVLQSGRVPGLPLSVVTTDFKDSADLTAWLAQKNVLVLYVEAGLSAELEGIRKICVSKKIVSVSPVRSFVERGLAAGIVLKGDRPAILINLTAAEAAGMDLDPKLLELSEIIR